MRHALSTSLTRAPIPTDSGLWVNPLIPEAQVLTMTVQVALAFVSHGVVLVRVRAHFAINSAGTQKIMGLFNSKRCFERAITYNFLKCGSCRTRQKPVAKRSRKKSEARHPDTGSNSYFNSNYYPRWQFAH